MILCLDASDGIELWSVLFLILSELCSFIVQFISNIALSVHFISATLIQLQQIVPCLMRRDVHNYKGALRFTVDVSASRSYLKRM